MTTKIKILSNISNLIIAQSSDRNYPGVLLQGDTLKILLDEVEELNEELIAKDYEAVNEIALALKEKLTNILQYYETTLETKNIELPYMSSAASIKNT